jgi:hypothetical protein
VQQVTTGCTASKKFFMKFINAVIISSLLLCCADIFYSCEKTNVRLEDNAASNDPDITYLEDNVINMSTVKMDSFITSGKEIFMVGTQADPVFGKMSANSYAEIVLPASNNIYGTDFIFDSICLQLLPTGNYSGDTTLPFKINVHRLTEPIANDDAEDSYYQTRTFNCDALPIASVTTVIKPTSKKPFSIRLPDALGQDWMQKLKTKDYVVFSQERFRDYFKGIVFRTDSSLNKNIFYFSSDSGKALIRIYYKERGLFTTSKQIDFTFNSNKQFTNITHNYAGTYLSLFNATKKEEFSSNLTGHQTLVHSNLPSFVKFTFPEILTLKELFPFVKVIKAELEIKPLEGSYRYPYLLPPTLLLAIGTSSNTVSSYLYKDGTTDFQTGNLVYDPLNIAKTTYSFDITSYISTVLSEGRFSEKTLLLSANVGSAVSESSVKDVKLKLYVLGL